MNGVVATFLRKILPMTPRLRPLEMADCPVLAAIHAQSFAAPWAVGDFQQMLVAGHIGDGLIAKGWFSPPHLIGFALSRIVLDEAEVITLALTPKWRAHGLSAPLLRAHMLRMRKAGAGTVFLEVAEDNLAARALYTRGGFVQISVREGYYAGKRALILKRDLDDLDPAPQV